MEYNSTRFQTVVVGNLGSQGLELFTIVDAPLLVNIETLDPGDELYVAMAERPKPPKRATDWKDVVKGRAAKKAKSDAALVRDAAPSMFVAPESL